MSTKERIYQLIDGFSDEQLNGLLTMLTGYAEIVEEAQDDAYCARLYKKLSSTPTATPSRSRTLPRNWGSASHEIPY